MATDLIIVGAAGGGVVFVKRSRRWGEQSYDGLIVTPSPHYEGAHARSKFWTSIAEVNMACFFMHGFCTHTSRTYERTYVREGCVHTVLLIGDKHTA